MNGQSKISCGYNQLGKKKKSERTVGVSLDVDEGWIVSALSLCSCISSSSSSFFCRLLRTGRFCDAIGC